MKRFEVIDYSDPRNPFTLLETDDEDEALEQAESYSHCYTRVEVYDNMECETIFGS